MKIDLAGRYIDGNWYRVTKCEALDLCVEASNGERASLPKVGYERFVEVNGAKCWLSRTSVSGEIVWAVHSHDFIPVS